MTRNTTKQIKHDNLLNVMLKVEMDKKNRSRVRRKTKLKKIINVVFEKLTSVCRIY